MSISRSPKSLDPSTCGIYSITCIPTGKVYVGHAQNMKSRWKKHQDDLFKRQHSSKELQQAFDTYGLHEFRFEPLETGVQPGSLGERELHWMTAFESWSMPQKLRETARLWAKAKKAGSTML